MKAIKLEILVLDFDFLGEDGVKEVIENARYPNRCISPEVKSVESVDIEWRDDHPLNRRDTSQDEYNRLFKQQKESE